MKFSSITIRIFDNVKLLDSLFDDIGIRFEKSRFNVLFYTLDSSNNSNFSEVFMAMKDIFEGKEEVFKSIASKKDIFIKVDDDSGNFGIDLPLDSLKYFSDLGFSLNFDIYAL
jgi:hypothetical protein